MMKTATTRYVLFVTVFAVSSVHGFTSPINSHPLLSAQLGNSLTKAAASTNSDLDASSLTNRRNLFQFASAAAASTVLLPRSAFAITTSADGLLPDLPIGATRDYLQYRVALQISADFYLWELQKKVGDIDDWGDVGMLFQVNNNNGQGQPSKIERDFTNTMRILSLSMPPDTADEMRDSQFKFEKAMAKISKATRGVRRDLPVEIDPALVVTAKQGWEEGRVGLNEFFGTLNKATGLGEMKQIPPAGPNQVAQYGRSQRRYFELTKKTKTCQNRGGPALSQAWGGLMVSGYLQDSCGIPDLNEYFNQI